MVKLTSTAQHPQVNNLNIDAARHDSAVRIASGAAKSADKSPEQVAMIHSSKEQNDFQRNQNKLYRLINSSFRILKTVEETRAELLAPEETRRYRDKAGSTFEQKVMQLDKVQSSIVEINKILKHVDKVSKSLNKAKLQKNEPSLKLLRKAISTLSEARQEVTRTLRAIQRIEKDPEMRLGNTKHAYKIQVPGKEASLHLAKGKIAKDLWSAIRVSELSIEDIFRETKRNLESLETQAERLEDFKDRLSNYKKIQTKDDVESLLIDIKKLSYPLGLKSELNELENEASNIELAQALVPKLQAATEALLSTVQKENQKVQLWRNSNKHELRENLEALEFVREWMGADAETIATLDAGFDGPSDRSDIQAAVLKIMNSVQEIRYNFNQEFSIGDVRDLSKQIEAVREDQEAPTIFGDRSSSDTRSWDDHEVVINVVEQIKKELALLPNRIKRRRTELRSLRDEVKAPAAKGENDRSLLFDPDWAITKIHKPEPAPELVKDTGPKRFEKKLEVLSSNFLAMSRRSEDRGIKAKLTELDDLIKEEIENRSGLGKISSEDKEAVSVWSSIEKLQKVLDYLNRAAAPLNWKQEAKKQELEQTALSLQESIDELKSISEKPAAKPITEPRSIKSKFEERAKKLLVATSGDLLKGRTSIPRRLNDVIIMAKANKELKAEAVLVVERALDSLLKSHYRTSHSTVLEELVNNSFESAFRRLGVFDETILPHNKIKRLKTISNKMRDVINVDLKKARSHVPKQLRELERLVAQDNRLKDQAFEVIDQALETLYRKHSRSKNQEDFRYLADVIFDGSLRNIDSIGNQTGLESNSLTQEASSSSETRVPKLDNRVQDILNLAKNKNKYRGIKIARELGKLMNKVDADENLITPALKLIEATIQSLSHNPLPRRRHHNSLLAILRENQIKLQKAS